MSSSIEEQFQPPEWSTKEEVIKAAQHYINYWKVEARHSNAQWLIAMERERQARNEIAFLKSEVARLKNNCDYLDQKLDEELGK